MPVNENGNPRPNGIAASIPIGPVGIGGTYYWDPGSPTAPAFTLTGGLGIGGGGLHSVFLRKGMTSNDTLGYGANANVWMLPSVGVNASIPDQNGIPMPWNAKVSSVEAGAGLPGLSANYTTTPQRMTDFLNKYVFGRAAGPNDELPPFVRSLQSSVGTIGPNIGERSVPFLSPRQRDPLGAAMGDWRSSVDPFDPQRSTQPAPPQQPALSPQEPGGLFGLLLEHLRNNPSY